MGNQDRNSVARRSRRDETYLAEEMNIKARGSRVRSGRSHHRCRRDGLVVTHLGKGVEVNSRSYPVEVPEWVALPDNAVHLQVSSGKQADRSITNDLHVSIATGLHGNVPLSGTIHHLSGPNTCARTPRCGVRVQCNVSVCVCAVSGCGCGVVV